MRLPPVNSELNDYSWISFKRISKRDWFMGFAYDWITNEDIMNAQETSDDEIKKDWQDIWEDGNDDQWRLFHAARIRTIVNRIERGIGVVPVSMDVCPFLNNTGCSYVGDGHHRIRAIQYLGYNVFPAYPQGLTNIVKPEIRVFVH